VRLGIEPLSFVSTKLAGQLLKRLKNITGDRAQELTLLGDEFTDPYELAEFYIEPHIQAGNPTDRNRGVHLPVPRQSAFALLNKFIDGGKPKYRDGSHQMFLLSDAGMGKSSLLLMIKLMHLADFWPQGCHCALFSLKLDSLKQIERIANKSDTVLLLDGLNEDRLSRNRMPERMLELVQACGGFRRVIISCRSYSFPDVTMTVTGHLTIRALAGYNCPVLYLSPFGNQEGQALIAKRLKGFGAGRRRTRASHLLDQNHSLRRQPILLQHIETLLECEGQQNWSVYIFYEALLHRWFSHILRTLKEKSSDCGHLPKDCAMFNLYVRLALWMEERDRMEITENALRKLLCKNTDFYCLEENLCPLLNKTSERTFRFSHSIFREFLLAYALVNKRYSFSFPVRATDQLMRFLELAGEPSDHFNQLDLTGFKPLRYVDFYAALFPWKDRFRSGDKRELIGPEMIILPGGRFRMVDTMIGNAQAMREVELDSFALGRYPVTFTEYNQFCRATGRRGPKDEGWGRERRPVINVSWHDAADYCDWLSRVTGRNYRLPTEAEWEYGCQAGSESMYCFGDNEHELQDYAWYVKNSSGKTQPVGEKKANAWGLYDMHGNVWEWCADWYGKDYAPSCPVRNPIGNEQGAGRILRGGSWDSNSKFVSSSFRFYFSPGLRIIRAGFRVALGHSE